MTTYKAPVDEILFLLKNVLKIDNDLAEPVLQEAAKLCEEEIAPTNQEGDKVGCIFYSNQNNSENNKVVAPECFIEPYRKFTEGGWIGTSLPERYGGQGMPFYMGTAVNEFVCSANMAFSLYPGLTRGAVQVILAAGSDADKEHYANQMITGKWTGTMNLTEPHCGTDLGQLKTKAVNKGNGTYEITGNKIFISAGEHNLSDNIIHLVLARVDGGPEGTRGISLFIVPKILADGTRNKVTAGAIEDKMGIHGCSTAQMFYDSATGYLLGQENKGLNYMFIMMNEMRLACAVQGLSQSELAYQNAVSYAKDRIQSAQLTAPKGESVPIINHPDVRRMLMDIRSVNEAARLLVLEASLLVDQIAAETSHVVEFNDHTQKILELEDRLGLLTPILKGVLTDYAVEHALKAQQVWGGHGYIKDNGMEQIVRDARITQIYEGTNGIQALDLVARKLPKNMGRAVRKFIEETNSYLNSDEIYGRVDTFTHSPKTRYFSSCVFSAVNDLSIATSWLMNNAISNPNNAGSAAYDYMKIFGLVLLGLAHVKICAATDDEDRHTTARYFMERVLPETKFLLKKIEAGSASMMSLPVDKF